MDANLEARRSVGWQASADLRDDLPYVDLFGLVGRHAACASAHLIERQIDAGQQHHDQHD